MQPGGFASLATLLDPCHPPLFLPPAWPWRPPTNRIDLSQPGPAASQPGLNPCPGGPSRPRPRQPRHPRRPRPPAAAKRAHGPESRGRPRPRPNRQEKAAVSGIWQPRKGKYDTGEEPEFAKRCGWPAESPRRAARGRSCPGHRIVAYYGDPLSKRMGALGNTPKARDAAAPEGWRRTGGRRRTRRCR